MQPTEQLPEHSSDRKSIPCPHYPGQVGWICPACGKGNAPAAAMCGHCAQNKLTFIPLNTDVVWR